MENFIFCAVLCKLPEKKPTCIIICFLNLDADECTSGTDLCQAPAVCRNTVGGYVCDCPSGYVSNSSFTCGGN